MADTSKGTSNGGRVGGPRCIALLGPFASGKTTLLEAILARTGAITRQGSVNEKNTVGDASPEARAHPACPWMRRAPVPHRVSFRTFAHDQKMKIGQFPMDCLGRVEQKIQSFVRIQRAHINAHRPSSEAQKFTQRLCFLRRNRLPLRQD